MSEKDLGNQNEITRQTEEKSSDATTSDAIIGGEKKSQNQETFKQAVEANPNKHTGSANIENLNNKFKSLEIIKTIPETGMEVILASRHQEDIDGKGRGVDSFPDSSALPTASDLRRREVASTPTRNNEIARSLEELNRGLVIPNDGAETLRALDPSIMQSPSPESQTQRETVGDQVSPGTARLDEPGGRIADSVVPSEGDKTLDAEETRDALANPGFELLKDYLYDKSDRSLVAMAFRLAGNEDLTRMASDAIGRITFDTISSVMRADQGSRLLREEDGYPILDLLTQPEWNALRDVLTPFATLPENAFLSKSAVDRIDPSNVARIANEDGTLKDESISGLARELETLPREGQYVEIEELNEALKRVATVSPDAALSLRSELKVDEHKRFDIEKVRKAFERMLEREPRLRQFESGLNLDAQMEPPSIKKETRGKSEASLDINSFASISRDVMLKISPTGTPVSKAQLANALEDPQFKGKEAQALVGLYLCFDRLHNLAGIDVPITGETISREDLEHFGDDITVACEKFRVAEQMEGWAVKNLERIGGSDGLSQSELDSAINDPKTSNQDRQILQKIKAAWGNLVSSPAADSCNISNFEHYSSSLLNAQEMNVISKFNAACTRVSEQGQQKAMCYELYGSDNPIENIKADDIVQGFIGDCYFEATLAGLAKCRPSKIFQSIRDNHDGSYTVRFAGAPDEPITVKKPTEAELGLYNGGSRHGVWAAVMEKAFGEYQRRHDLIAQFRPTPQEGADGGGYSGPVIKLLTGHNATDKSWISGVFPPTREVSRAMIDAFSSHPPRVVTAAVKADLLSVFGIGKETAAKFPKGHQYTILGFEPRGDSDGVVIVRNPWGHKDDSTSGTIRISLKKFLDNFNEITTENPN